MGPHFPVFFKFSDISPLGFFCPPGGAPRAPCVPHRQLWPYYFVCLGIFNPGRVGFLQPRAGGKHVPRNLPPLVVGPVGFSTEEKVPPRLFVWAKRVFFFPQKMVGPPRNFGGDI